MYAISLISFSDEFGAREVRLCVLCTVYSNYVLRAYVRVYGGFNGFTAV